ncbi:MAG: hypothetical protein GY856_01485 [bacterium]|nr:hypothetical protein [bacterium]
MLCRLTCILGLALLLAAPAVAEDVKAGFDFWQTVGSGATGYSFAENPIPAGFFCSGSKAFKDDVTFEGTPLKSDPDRALGTTDTIVERLDTAKFDGKGKATTRIQVRALNLEGRSTINNSCGKWAVQASLSDKEQPITTMTLQRTKPNPDTGVFSANLVLDVELAFTNVSTGKTVSLTRTMSLPTAKETPYATGALAEKDCYSSAVPAGMSVYLERGDLIVTSSNQFAPACACNDDGTICLPITEEHTAFDDENHFTMPPCQYFGHLCVAEVDVYDAILTQMKDYSILGVIDEDPFIATEKIVNKVF